MNFTKISIEGAYEVILSPFEDERGAFSRIFCSDEFRKIGLNESIVQINHSINNSKGTLRGMHFQYAPFSETKIIRCLKGRVYDVIVDIRENSPTFLKWQAIELTPLKYNMFYIPKGCAHGFQSLEENSELLYLHTMPYHPEAEGSFRFNDPLINIEWPLAQVNVSRKDMNYPLLNESFKGVKI
jgi:dTDP-4-dehydrorhamnose 3,5-epimerase